MARAAGIVTNATERCKGCGMCTLFCPLDILVLSHQSHNSKGYQPVSLKDATKCTGCGNCFQMCPDYAIEVERITRLRG